MHCLNGLCWEAKLYCELGSLVPAKARQVNKAGCLGGLICVSGFDNNVRTVFESGGKAQTRVFGVQKLHSSYIIWIVAAT